MAEKRMFSNKVIGSDAFLEMPDSTQNLYFHLSMYADDDGFVDKVKTIMRMTGKKEDDLKLLIAKSFIIPFESGVIVIKHWKINNYLRSDRYHETQYLNEKLLLSEEKNGEYVVGTPTGIPAVTIDKNRLDKNSIEKEKVKKEKFTPPTLEEVKEYAKSRGREDLAIKFFEYFDTGKWIDSEGKPVKNWKQKFITWDNKNQKPQSTKKTESREYSDKQLNDLFDNTTEIQL